MFHQWGTIEVKSLDCAECMGGIARRHTLYIFSSISGVSRLQYNLSVIQLLKTNRLFVVAGFWIMFV